jgi:alanine dehydrogenase
MDIGIPRETFKGENRIALSPLAVRELTQAGHDVYIETGAGRISFYDDSSYVGAGATVVYSPEEAFGRAQLVAKIERPNDDELELLQTGQVLMSFLQPSATEPKKFRQLMEKKITAIGYEIIQKDTGGLPIVRSLSEIAGQMTVCIASRYLESNGGGRGILLGGAPGVPPAEVVIIGAGNLGRSAARYATAMGASVTLMDTDVDQLRKARRRISATVVTAIATEAHIEKALSYADVLITAIMVRGGGRVENIVSREMVRRMKKGSVIIDTSIDLGGAVETSRPTTLDNPVYVEEGVVHYCVPNISSAVPRTASRVLADAVMPYIKEIANEGLESCLRNRSALARGVFTYGGHCCNRQIAELFGLPFEPLDKLLGIDGGNK